MKDSLLKGCTPYQQYLFLTAEVDSIPDPPSEDLHKLFDLICDFDPQSAKSFLQKHSDNLDLEIIKEKCTKKGIIDCTIQILTDVGNFSGAVTHIGAALENALITFITTSKNIDKIQTLDEMSRITNPEFQTAYQSIKIAIDLLKSTKTEKGCELQWQNMFKHFQFPLYLIQTDYKDNEALQNAVTLLFSFFVVEALNEIPTSLAFTIIAIYFGLLETKIYRSILGTIFSRLDYQKNLNKNIEEMMIEDCLDLVNQSFIKATKGIQSDATVRCSSCLQQLSKGTDPITVFPCGHCFHAKEECGNYKSCPICTSGVVRVSSTQESTVSKISTRRIQQLMRRMEFSLRKNWGNSKENKNNFAASFLAKKEDLDVVGEIDFSYLGTPESVIQLKILSEEEKAQQETEAEAEKEEKEKTSKPKKHRRESTKQQTNDK